MIHILITGLQSYVGNQIEHYFRSKNDWTINKISLRDKSWVSHDFSQYDTIIHVAGIAHARKKTFSNDDYEEINNKLATKVAEKAKQENVKQLIFMSTMLVYDSASGYIDFAVKPNPKEAYGISKLNAEMSLNNLASANFKVVILRPSMIYGFNSKGNFKRLIQFVKWSLLFPEYPNLRSFLYIDHLSEAIYQIVLNKLEGTFHLANTPPTSTTHLVREISKVKSSRIFLISWFNLLLKRLIPFSSTLNKMFGNFYYADELTQQEFNYRALDFKETIHRSIKGQAYDE